MIPSQPPLEYAAQRPRGGYRWLVVFMLWMVCFLNYADRQAVSAILPKLGQEFRFTKVQLGEIGSAFMWVYALASPAAGIIGDRLRRKDLILGGCLFWSAITACTGRCSALWQFLAVRASEGFGEAFYMPASMSLLSDYHGRATRSKALAIHQSSVYVGTVAGSWIAALLAERLGWRWGFYLFGSAGIALSLFLYAFLREPRRGQSDLQIDAPAKVAASSEPRPSIWSVLSHPAAVLLMLAFLGANFVAAVFLIWMPTFLVDKFHLGLASAGLMGTAFIQLSSAVAAPLGGIAADRLARSRRDGRMIVQAGGLFAGAAFVFYVGVADRLAILIVAMTLFGFCKGLYDSNIFASLYDAVDPRLRSTAAGFMNTVGWGGGSLGPLSVGFATQYAHFGSQVRNMSLAIAATSVIYVASAILILLAARSLRKSVSPQDGAAGA